ncbi:MAG: alpha/beta hydrolase [Betaproteobacteria bacterium]|nr:alpha/beta hydrolase [Betaproteobacteria bacterium]NCP82238.1 alpha/beta hydrolase [Rhodoferax sp.]
MASWIFLRGLSRESGHWGDFVDTFQTRFSSEQVVLLDLPGNGVLHYQGSPTHVHAMVDAYRAQLAQRGLTPPYHLLALSLGGMVAVAWAQTHPHEVAGQVLINTSMRPFSPFYQRLRPANYLTLLRLALPGCNDAVLERTVLNLTSACANPIVLPDWLALRERHPVSTRNTLAQLLAAARFQADRQAPSAATLVLASTHDQLVSVQCSLALAAAWHSRVCVHPWAGHDLPLDDGAWVTKQIAQWQVTKLS